MDESGTHDRSPVVIVAAYVARPRAWREWTKRWNGTKRPIKVSTLPIRRTFMDASPRGVCSSTPPLMTVGAPARRVVQPEPSRAHKNGNASSMRAVSVVRAKRRVAHECNSRLTVVRLAQAPGGQLGGDPWHVMLHSSVGSVSDAAKPPISVRGCSAT
jgi:hypothetical protein